MSNLQVNAISNQTDINSTKKNESISTGRTFFSIVRSFTIETTKIFAVSLLIANVVKHTFGHLEETLRTDAYDAVLFAPVIEEIFFRTIIQNGLKFSQNQLYKHLRGREATEEELRYQKHFRVITTGVLFGLIHLTNSYSNMISKVISVSLITFGGIGYGYIREETNTTASTILSHATYNYLLQCAVTDVIPPGLAILAATIMDIALFVIGIVGFQSIKESLSFGQTPKAVKNNEGAFPTSLQLVAT